MLHDGNTTCLGASAASTSARASRCIAARALSVALLASLAGCAGGTRPAGVRVLVPGDETRPPRLVQLPANWAVATIAALRASPGCLGVDFARLQSGKRAIFAMFKDKAAAISWYRNETHLALVEQVRFYRDHEHAPLARVADGAGPILVVATMTPADAAPGGEPGAVLLSVELFSPMQGGVRFGDAALLPR